MISSTNKAKLPRVLPGFEHIKRHWSDNHSSSVAVIEPGQLYVTNQPELIMTTLGSCISACVRDPITLVGGMNHFMLPSKGNIYQSNAEEKNNAMRYGNWAMEYLINEILKNGAKRRNLEVKIFGGGGTLDNSAVCDLNIQFITEYIHDENLKLLAKDVGGADARNVIYNAVTGKILMKKLKTAQRELIESERTYSKSIMQSQEGNDVQLF